MTNVEKFILGRWVYKFGGELIDDGEYNLIEAELKQSGALKDYLTRTYDDDPEPVELLVRYPEVNQLVDELKEGTLIEDNSAWDKWKDIMQENKSISIKPISEYSIVFEFLRQARQSERKLILMLKANGINTRTLYTKNKNRISDKAGHSWYTLTLGSTRGRKGDPHDITVGMSKILPVEIEMPTEVDYFFVWSECYVEERALIPMRQKYLKFDTWKTPRSTALSWVRVPVEDVDYQHAKAIVWDISGLGDIALSKRLDIAEEYGFGTIPATYVDLDAVPYTLDEFKEYMDFCIEVMGKTCDDEFIPCDGLVLAYDGDATVKELETENQYTMSSIAIKLGRWAGVRYKSRVRAVIWEQGKSKFTPVALIEPVVLVNGVTARRVNCYSPSKVLEYKIKKGNLIYFEQVSDAIQNVVGGGSDGT